MLKQMIKNLDKIKNEVQNYIDSEAELFTVRKVELSSLEMITIKVIDDEFNEEGYIYCDLIAKQCSEDLNTLSDFVAGVHDIVFNYYK